MSRRFESVVIAYCNVVCVLPIVFGEKVILISIVEFRGNSKGRLVFILNKSEFSLNDIELIIAEFSLKL
jgi:hypothetical protein